MCSYQCPTYLLKQDENESPRGRIALAQAIAGQSIRNNETAQHHLETCLNCLRCEKICPSKVSYSKIKSNVDLLLEHEDDSGKLVTLLSRLTCKNWRRLGNLFRYLNLIGLLPLVTRVFFSQHRFYLRPMQKLAIDTNADAELQIFSGCLSNIFDQQTQASLFNFLKACSISYNIPDKQQCCGSLAKHNGKHTVSLECMDNNEAVFTADKPVLFTASGCGAHLKRQKASFNFVEAGDFLLQDPRFHQLTFKPLNNIKVLIHSPCSEKNTLNKSSSLQILKKIPDIKLLELTEATPCCGAAGSHMLKHPHTANAIRQFTEAEIHKARPDIIVSTNYTCAMHIAAGLKQKGLDIEVMHPLSLLHRQLIQR